MSSERAKNAKDIVINMQKERELGEKLLCFFRVEATQAKIFNATALTAFFDEGADCLCV